MTQHSGSAGSPLGIRRLLPDAVCVGAVWSLLAAFWWPLVTPDAGSRLYFGRGDLSDQFFAFRRFSSGQLWSGDLPLWNPGIFAGHPALADIQSAVFYPISLLATLFAGPNGASLARLQLEILAGFWLGALFMYLFAHRATGQRGAATLAALIFGLGGYLTSYPPEQLPVLQGSVWLPLALFFAHGAWSAVGWDLARKSSWVGASLGVSVLAGHPQVAMLLFYTSLIYLSFGLWRRGRMAAALGAPALAGAVGLGIGAIQWLPTVEFMAVSTRAVMPFDDAQAGFPLGDLLTPLFPGFVGRSAPLYVGLLPLLLAVVAVGSTLGNRRRPSSAAGSPAPSQVAFWALLAAAAFLLGFGGNTVLYGLPYLSLPGYGLFRGQERLALVYTVAVAMLAALGAARMAGHGEGGLKGASLASWRRPACWSLCVCAGLALAFGAAAAGAESGGKLGFAFLIERSVHAGLALAAAILIISGRLRGRLGPAAFLTGALVLTAADLAGVAWPAGVTPADPTTAFSRYPAIVSYLKQQPQPFRVHNDRVLPENFGAVHGIAAVQGNSPLRIRALQDLEARLDAWRFWQLTDVRFVLSRGDPGSGATLVLREGDAALYRLDAPRPAWVVGDALLAGGDVESLALLALPEFDPRSVAVVRDANLTDLDGLTGSATVTVYRSQYVAIDVQSEGRGLLVVSELDYPGWRARVDGLDVPVYRVNHAFRGVLLGPGSHRVEFHYQPASLVLGAALTGLAVFGLAVLTFRRRL